MSNTPDTLQIDMDTMKEQAEDIKKAVAGYKNFGNSPFSEELGMLSGMNADFVARFQTMVKNMNDGNEKLVQTLNEISTLTYKVLEKFEQIDSQSASAIGSK